MVCVVPSSVGPPRRPAPGAASDRSSGSVRNGTSTDSATTLVDRTTADERLRSTRTCCRASCERGRDPAEDVAAARGGVRLEQAGDGLEVALHVLDRPLRDLQGHEGLDAEAGRGHVDVRPVAGDDAAVLQPLQPGGHRRAGDAGDAGQLQGAGARVLAQRREQRDVQGVEGPLVCHADNYASCTARTTQT